jgi:hypothetical protein
MRDQRVDKMIALLDHERKANGHYKDELFVKLRQIGKASNYWNDSFSVKSFYNLLGGRHAGIPPLELLEAAAHYCKLSWDKYTRYENRNEFRWDPRFEQPNVLAETIEEHVERTWRHDSRAVVMQAYDEQIPAIALLDAKTRKAQTRFLAREFSRGEGNKVIGGISLLSQRRSNNFQTHGVPGGRLFQTLMPESTLIAFTTGLWATAEQALSELDYWPECRKRGWRPYILTDKQAIEQLKEFSYLITIGATCTLVKGRDLRVKASTANQAVQESTGKLRNLFKCKGYELTDERIKEWQNHAMRHQR